MFCAYNPTTGDVTVLSMDIINPSIEFKMPMQTLSLPEILYIANLNIIGVLNWIKDNIKKLRKSEIKKIDKNIKYLEKLFSKNNGI
jgi:hypothetical protein